MVNQLFIIIIHLTPDLPFVVYHSSPVLQLPASIPAKLFERLALVVVEKEPLWS